MRCFLTVSRTVKTVPYPAPDSARPARGYIALKGADATTIATLPEVRDFPPYQQLIAALNKGNGPFFSIGCEQITHDTDDGPMRRGYVEFAFEDCEKRAVSEPLFTLFAGFSALLAGSDLPVQFHWDIQPVHFSAGGHSGHSACLWITTRPGPQAGAQFIEACAQVTRFIETAATA